MLIRIIETNATVTVEHFFEMHPCLVLPQPPSNEDLAPHGARLVEPEPQPEPVPASCTRRQGRLALLALGLIDDAEAALESIEDATELRAARIEYEADTWERSNPFLQQLWSGLGGSPEQLDDAFRLAVTL